MHDPSLVGLHHLGFDGVEPSNLKKIQARARQLLCRSLNIGRTIAFVGSGVSKAYGYPDWDQLLDGVVARVQEILPHRPPPSALTDDKSLVPRVERHLLNLTLCDEHLRRHARDTSTELENLSEIVANLIRERHRRAEKSSVPQENNPLWHILMRLRIRRFITTNYDQAIEKALHQHLGYPKAPLGLREEQTTPHFASSSSSQVARSLAFGRDRPEELVQFAVAAPGYEAGVFHLHGVFTVTDSLIVTERDYQRIYLTEEPVYLLYRTALDLVFSGNPILFVGLGTQETELLRPRRRFVSGHQREANDWPFYALQPEPKSNDCALEYWRYMYTRFGIKVIYFDDADDDYERTKHLCNELDKLSSERETWWDGWQEKPAIREPAYDLHDTNNNRLMIRHYVNERGQYFGQLKDVDNLKACLKATSKYVTIILGGEGTGKGYLSTLLVTQPKDYLDKWPDNAKRFLGTTHFTNDLLSIIDSAQHFLTDGPANSGDALDRLCLALKGSCHLLVIGGLQRMLSPPSLNDNAYESRMNHPPFPVGQPINHEIRRFLEMVQGLAVSGRSHIVLTSSVWPSTLNPKMVNVVRLEGVSADEICKANPYNRIDDKTIVMRMHHAVKGHAYAISVIAKVLDVIENPEETKRWLQKLTSYLTAIDLTRRPAEVIKAVVREYRIRWKAPPDDCTWSVMTRIALIGTPVNAQDIADTYLDIKGPAKVETAIDKLVEAHLLLCLERPCNKPKHFTAHTLVRAYVLHELGSVADALGEPQQLTLSDFTSDVTAFHPGTHDGHTVAIDVIDSLLASSEQLPLEQRINRRRLPRAAFGLLRAH